MTFSATLRRGLALLLCAAFWVGCQPPGTSRAEEERDPNYLSGLSRESSGDPKGAKTAFEKALVANPQSASAHRKLGLLYATKLEDHAAAIYHLQKALELDPKDALADVLQQHILACRKALALQFSPQGITSQRELERFVAENTQLRLSHSNLVREVLYLRQALAQRQAQPAPTVLSNTLPPLPISNRAPEKVLIMPTGPSPQPPTTDSRTNLPTASPATTTTGGRQILPTPKPNTTRKTEPATASPTTSFRPRTHAVRPGDTFASIARTYGVSTGALASANPGVNFNKLRAGQILRVPPKAGRP